MKLLLDTNVLLDYYLRREPYFGIVKDLFIAKMFDDVQLWGSSKSYTDIFYIAKKYVDAHELQQAFLSSFEEIDLCSIEAEDIKRAAELSWPDFEDCLISAAAEKIKADAIVTRDVDGFKASAIPAMTPAQVMDQLKGQGLIYETVIFD